ncbi:MSHA biogenesis protein MshI [Aestuariibacter salexigens]|uniref:MSHA biogenesis protein MshI n=1 Tax=Aestuariibacter salexigens TaxID=226010 RepID=UPI0003FE5443|nr:MSHA biogenesis protein MshI [Aestuariibacter salexigens]
MSAFKGENDTATWSHQQTFGQQNWPVKLAQWIKQIGAQGTPCHVVYSIDWYQLLQVDRPQVEAAEISQALSWSIQDIIQTDKAQFIDYFDPPCQVAGADKVNVVAMPQEQLTQLAKDILDCELDLQSIGIEELAICELLPVSDEAIITLVQEPGQEICLNIVKQGNLYFSRRLKGFENLASFSESELQMGVVDSLCVQVQRSMDYFDSQLRQAPVKRILIAVDSPVTEALAKQIQQLVLIPVEPLSLSITHAQDLNADAASFISLGAALTRSAAS